MKLCDLLEKEVLDVKTLTVAELAARHKVSVQDIEKEIVVGIKHELEHTKRHDLAREIAMDHIKEDPRYYQKLDKAMPDERVE